MGARKNVPFGVQSLTLIHVQVSGTRVSFVFSAGSDEFNEVVRTFTLGSSQLSEFMEAFYRAPKAQWNETDFKNLVGKSVRAEIAPARNPTYVNLNQVLEVLSSPAAEGSILKPSKPVTDSQSSSHLRRKKVMESDVG